jgi:hypothetical protein
MRRVLIVGLLLAATSAYADEIWRLWCGNPPTARRGIFDSSNECHHAITEQMADYANHCVDTSHGMVWKEDGTPMNADDANCRAGYDVWARCFCQAEAVEPK